MWYDYSGAHGKVLSATRNAWLWLSLAGGAAGQTLDTSAQTGHIGPVKALAFDDTEQLLATGGEDSYCRIWDIATGLEYAAVQSDVGRVTTIAWSPDSS